MSQYKLILLTENAPDREDEYNDWYTNHQMMDMASVPGITGAQRLKLESTFMGEFKNRYLTIYDMETEDPLALMAQIRDRGVAEGWVTSNAIDGSRNIVGVFKAITDRVPHTPRQAPAS